MRILTTLATAAALTLAAATSALACSGYKNNVTAQSPMPQAEEQKQGEATTPAATPAAPTVAAESTSTTTDVAQAPSSTTVKPN